MFTCSSFAIAIVTVVTAQCNRVQFFEDGNDLMSSSPTLSRAPGDSFVIGCRRCDTSKGRPRWFYPNRTEISPCDISDASVCTKDNANDNVTRDLCFTSFTPSLAITYECTVEPIIINIVG